MILIKIETNIAMKYYTQENVVSNPNQWSNNQFKKILKTIMKGKLTKEMINDKNINYKIDKFGRIISNSTYQTTSTINFRSPLQNSLSMLTLRKNLKSPEKKNIDKLLEGWDINGIYSSPRFPKAKPFNQQAYAAKSKVEAFSQASSKVRKFEKFSNIKNSFPNSPKINRKDLDRALPPLRKERFNEEIRDEISIKTK